VQPGETSRDFYSSNIGWPPKNLRKSIAYFYGLIRYQSRDGRDEWVQYFCLSRGIKNNGSFGVFNGNKKGRYNAREYNALVQTRADGVDKNPL
jgi:hypothetical protein